MAVDFSEHAVITVCLIMKSSSEHITQSTKTSHRPSTPAPLPRKPSNVSILQRLRGVLISKPTSTVDDPTHTQHPLLLSSIQQNGSVAYLRHQDGKQFHPLGHQTQKLKHCTPHTKTESKAFLLLNTNVYTLFNRPIKNICHLPNPQ